MSTAAQNDLVLDATYEAEALAAAALREVQAMLQLVTPPERTGLFTIRAMVIRMATLNSAVMSAVGGDDVYLAAGYLKRDVRGFSPGAFH